MVLQNRPALDMITASQGRTCATLGEECCFNVNKSGEIQNIKQILEKTQRPKGKSCKRIALLGRNLVVSLPWKFACNLLILLISPYLINSISRFISPRPYAFRCCPGFGAQWIGHDWRMLLLTVYHDPQVKTDLGQGSPVGRVDCLQRKKRDFLSLNNPQKIWENFVPQQGVDVGVQGLQG
jgi:hypothetical protein